MAQGDVIRLTLSGPGLATDVTWLPGAIMANYPVDVVSVGRPAAGQAVVSLRVRGGGPMPVEGKVIASPSMMVVPGMPAPSATVQKVETTSSAPPGDLSMLKFQATDQMKWVGAVALIALTALLASRIEEPT